MKLKNVQYLLLMGVVFFVSSCGGSSKTEKLSKENQATENTVASAALDLDQLLNDADQHAGKEVTVEAICTHICAHGGKKIFLMGSDDTKTIRVESGNGDAFSADCVNSIVEVTGTLREQRMTEESLAKWEEQVKAQASQAKAATHESCDSDKKARGETADTPEARIADFRARIAKRKTDEGKDYLSFYFIEANSYEIQS